MLFDGHKTVAAAGTREQLSTTGVEAKQVTVTALEGNTGKVVVGGADVVAALASRAGIPLAAGESATLDISDLQEVWVDVMVNGEGVSYLANTLSR